ncbi:PorP/SprF family type IX secretion system membrane protein [Reichenbachiella agariperforans]|nr:PorP/SprF family type IX secretion system membrane protein [Reichenbachiella agariperforans]
MKHLIIQVLLLIITLDAASQSNVVIGQYYQLMPVFAPALNGANDFIDIRMGTRQQWIGYEGAPKTQFISGSGVIKLDKNNPHKYNSVRVSDMSPYTTKGTKIGIGGYVFSDKIGAIDQIEIMTSTAIHVPVSSKMYLSLGFSFGVYNTNVDISNLFVLRPQNDAIYQEYLHNQYRNTYLKLNSGISAYSDRFYISYSIINSAYILINGDAYNLRYSSSLLHNLLGGYRLNPWPKIELIPNAYLRYSTVFPFLFDVGIRVRYDQNLYSGLSYRNDGSIISMLGFMMNNKYSFGYSYEIKTSDNGQNSSSHEIILGIQLKNKKRYSPIW